MPRSPTVTVSDYASLRAYESDYNRSQGGVKQIASAWLLATLGAFAWMLFSADSPKEAGIGWLLALTLAAIGNIGLFLLWWIDQYVYQRLLHATFTYGLYLEWLMRDDPDFVKPRTALYVNSGDMAWRFSLFYHLPMTLLAVIGALYLFAFQAFYEPATLSEKIFDCTNCAHNRFFNILSGSLFAVVLGTLLYAVVATYRYKTLPSEFGKVYGQAFADAVDDADEFGKMLLHPPSREISAKRAGHLNRRLRSSIGRR